MTVCFSVAEATFTICASRSKSLLVRPRHIPTAWPKAPALEAEGEAPEEAEEAGEADSYPAAFLAGTESELPGREEAGVAAGAPESDPGFFAWDMNLPSQGKERVSQGDDGDEVYKRDKGDKSGDGHGSGRVIIIF